jgi:hypothetical protein
VTRRVLRSWLVAGAARGAQAAAGPASVTVGVATLGARRLTTDLPKLPVLE